MHKRTGDFNVVVFQRCRVMLKKMVLKMRFQSVSEGRQLLSKMAKAGHPEDSGDSKILKEK